MTAAYYKTDQQTSNSTLKLKLFVISGALRTVDFQTNTVQLQFDSLTERVFEKKGYVQDIKVLNVSDAANNSQCCNEVSFNKVNIPFHICEFVWGLGNGFTLYAITKFLFYSVNF